jgi:ketosteroid isomerase-like protein
VTVGDGRVTRIRFYLDRTEALEAAGADQADLQRSGD